MNWTPNQIEACLEMSVERPRGSAMSMSTASYMYGRSVVKLALTPPEGASKVHVTVAYSNGSEFSLASMSAGQIKN